MSLLTHALTSIAVQPVHAALRLNGKELKRTDACPETEGATIKFVAQFDGAVNEFDEIAFFSNDSLLKSKKIKSQTKSEQDSLSACWSITINTGV